METIERDQNILRHILIYCDQIETAHRDFGRSEERFRESTTYQNAIAMCILQIGELVGRLSSAFQEAHPEIPWRKIRGMRNYVAHEYGTIDVSLVWYTAGASIDELHSFCSSYLNV
ncbi:MAG: DUF86 domain-containing protein [Clostridia bacterium]|nr:DUF86 domain-containing protein [Clostridia bacterium]